eukprot:CAMPEP_0116136768 /NCGR_PEP_ID=MMETSP0329-20121206/11905_1 /TAXON_ID=697910 /ORGANISM="Pseudo-nitzschia arenysensis, Strain B593" /LENGTH=624 /DNA_ID=CAMNT_0003631667 /DNA_START=28 /DNA_END=1902 /DNA_ORIENTATION=-
MASVSTPQPISLYIEEILARSSTLSDGYYNVFLPWCSEFAARLELPAWELYREAWGICTRDILKAWSSAYRVSYLTLKPIAILLWIILGHVWKFILENGGRSLHTIAIHLKLACIHFIRFQMSLNQTQLLGEAGLIAMCVGIYYFRKWLQRQTYWAKFVGWYRTKKRRISDSYKAKKRRFLKAYTDTMHKIAKVSKILAMAFPHLVFLGLAFGLLMFIPGVIRWITYETPTIVILSFYYPLVSTLVLVHTERHGWGDDDERNNKNKGLSKKKLEAKALETINYWLNYWQLYALIQAIGSCLSMIPIVGRFLVSHPIVGFFTGECKLFFFVWIFGMERVLGKTSTDAFLAEILPLAMIQKFIRPQILQFHSTVSNAISNEFWQKWAVSKTQTTLDIAVMLRLLSEKRRDWLVHIVQEARVLTLPSITLLMPGFVTQFGVAYVQYIVPSAKSAENSRSSKTKKVLYLQYWILHCATAGLLYKLTGILWWLPFSTHMIFLLWSYLSLPQTIQNWYRILESELVAFGILPKSKDVNENDDTSSVVRISDTKTAWLFQSLVDRLPSAEAKTDEQKDGESILSLNKTNSTESTIESVDKVQEQPPPLTREATTDKKTVNNDETVHTKKTQ